MGQRVAFNEGYQKQKILEANEAGREAFSLGLDRSEARSVYLDKRAQLASEAKDFLLDESAAQNNEADFIEGESETIETDPVGAVTDGEETLGMESVVANETEDLSGGFDMDEYQMAPVLLSDEAFAFYAENGGHLRDILEIDSVWDDAHQMDLNYDTNGYTSYEEWEVAGAY